MTQSKDDSSEIHIENPIIEISTCEKLLGIKIDSKLRFVITFKIYLTKPTENYEH